MRDEKRRELQKRLEEEERLRRLKLGEYRQGDVDLELIKRYARMSIVNSCRILRTYLHVPEFHFRLSIQIGANEEHLGPDPSKFREGHTKVSDVERIYLTGKYKEKYKTISNYYNAPESLKHKVYPVMENGTRKIRSAYPSVVRVKSSRMSHHANACIYANEDHVREISIKSAALSRINC